MYCGVMEKSIEIENIKKISEPKRSTSTKYPYIVHIRTKSLKLQRKYFATSEEAWRFVNEIKAKLGDLPQLNYAMSGNSIESSDQLENTHIILKTHYMALITKAKAKEFYSILPKD